MLQPIKSTSLITEVTDQIKNLILKGTLKPGDKLPSEQELCNELGVSRTAIREAKKSLIGMGLLQSKRGFGTYVRDDTVSALSELISLELMRKKSSIKELIDARRVIEVASAGWAAERATEDDIEKLKALLEKMNVAMDAANSRMFQDCDLEWHSVIAKASQNKVNVLMSMAIRNLLEIFIHEMLKISGSELIAHKGHTQVTDAIIARNVEEAELTMTQHLNDVERMGLDHAAEYMIV